MKTIAWAWGVALISACGGATTTSPATSSAESVPTMSSATSSDEPPTNEPTESAPVVSSRPPSGAFDLRVLLVRDTCSPKVATAFTRKGLLVLGHTDAKGVLMLNLPSATSPTSVVSRADTATVVGSTLTRKSNPDSSCVTYEVQQAVVVKVVEHDRIVLTRIVKYGDATGCTVTTPVGCEVESEDTYSLVHADCEAPCAGRIDMSLPSAPKIICTCP